MRAKTALNVLRGTNGALQSVSRSAGFKSLAVRVLRLDIRARRYPECNALFRRRRRRRVVVGVAVVGRRRGLGRRAAATGLPALPDRRAGRRVAAALLVVAEGGRGGAGRLRRRVVERVVAGVEEASSAGAAVARQRRLRAELVGGEARRRPRVEVGQRQAARPRRLRRVPAAVLGVHRVPVAVAVSAGGGRPGAVARRRDGRGQRLGTPRHAERRRRRGRRDFGRRTRRRRLAHTTGAAAGCS